MIIDIIFKRKLREHLAREGYSMGKLHISNRYLYTKIIKKGIPYFFKMALKDEYNIQIKNEYYSSQFLTKKLYKLPSIKVRSVITLNVFDYRRYSLFYLISEYIPGKHMLDQNYSFIEKKQIIKEAALLAYELSEMSSLRIKLFHRPSATGDYVFNSAKSFADKRKPYVIKILNLIARTKKNIGYTYSHGDYSPLHIFSMDNQLIVIDTEHAGVKPEYYDVAHFYMRLRQNGRNKRLASYFLKEYIALLPQNKKKTFWSQFRPVLAERTLGYMWELQNNFNYYGSSKSPYPLLKDIVENSLL